MILLSGKKIADKILNNLKKEIEKKRLKLKMAIVLVGDDAPSKIFTKRKEEASKKIGVYFRLFHFKKDISLLSLKKEIEKISLNKSVSGLVIQLPLPDKLKPHTQEILNIIPKEKDIDILSENNLGSFYSGFLKVMPPVVGAIYYLLREYKISVKGKNVVIVGAGRLVGLPLAIFLLKEKATVSVINQYTEDTKSFLKKADIIISGVGKPNIIKGKDIKKGVAIIDVGSSLKDKKIVGDVDFKSVSKKAKYITPVPGGVGPLTVTSLLENLVKLNIKK